MPQTPEMTPEMKKISKLGNPSDILDGMDKLDTLANRKADLERRKRDLKTWKSRKGDSGWWAHSPSSTTNNQSEKKITNLKYDINNNKQKIDKLQNKMDLLDSHLKKRMDSLQDQFKKSKKTKKRGLFGGGRKRQIFNTNTNPFRSSSNPFSRSSNPLSRIGSSFSSSSPFSRSSNPFRRRGPFGGKRKKTRKQKRKSRTRRRR